ncbi:MAG: hypothetical protein FK734_14370 [Asgard group archaeon]|nr:hypothetical protein [Asgard group archaeon]
MKDSTTETITVCCTWQDEKNCEGCQNNLYLDCRWEAKHLLRFFYAMGPALIFAFLGIILGDVFTLRWWQLGVLLGYYTIFFIIETRILCSHCPYYSEKSLILHCLANHGFIKYCRYHPEPLNRFEKTLLVIGIFFFGAVPLGLQIYNIVILSKILILSSATFISLLVILGLTVGGLIFGFTFLFTKICTHCINFSCPFNSVPKELIDSYLEKNPYMKEAWVKAGYKINNDEN